MQTIKKKQLKINQGIYFRNLRHATVFRIPFAPLWHRYYLKKGAKQ